LTRPRIRGLIRLGFSPLQFGTITMNTFFAGAVRCTRLGSSIALTCLVSALALGCIEDPPTKRSDESVDPSVMMPDQPPTMTTDPDASSMNTPDAGPPPNSTNVTMNNATEIDMSPPVEPDRDKDEDGVIDREDPAPNDPRVCGDSDNDGCDDCSVRGRFEPSDDGYDRNRDGRCELPLDYECMNGANAESDPHRLESCVMMTHVNNDRAHFGEESNQAAPVRWNEDIWVVAIAHSRDMCNRQFFEHVNPDDEGPTDRGNRAGLNLPLAENISLNFDPGAAEYGFMAEPTCEGHRGNILSPLNTEIGIGYHVCNNRNYEPWGEHHHITQNFRMDFDKSEAPFCEDPAKACEVPPNPPSTATCPEQLANWGFCDRVGEEILDEWDCPDD
jgi:hypothetical protein